MEYQGFRSIREYEAESARAGQKTRRIPFHKGAGKYFALISSPPGHPTGTSVESWTLFSADESRRVMDGIINAYPENYLGKLAAQGYYPDNPEAEEAAKSCAVLCSPASTPASAPPPAPEPAPVLSGLIVENGDFPQFSFLV